MLVNTSKKGFEKDPNKKVKKQLSKTKNLFETDLNMARVTVEVLDDGSPDITPRQDYEANKGNRLNKSISNIMESAQLQESEEQYRQQGFHDEKTRVTAKSDIFVPAPGISAESVDKERIRLFKLEESSRIAALKYRKEVIGRKEYLAKDYSAIKIQKSFRGFIGRKLFSLVQRIRDINNGNAVEWIEVRDRESGDTWYYNTINGSSQWDKPKNMVGKIAPPKNVKRLPNMKGDKTPTTKKSKGNKLKQLTSTSLPDLHKQINAAGTTGMGGGEMDVTMQAKWQRTATQYEEEEVDKTVIKKELREAFNVGVEHDSESTLIAPDGSFKPQLRTTVLNALTETRFDSISSVLADQRWIEEPKDKSNQQKSKSTADQVDPSRKAIVSMLTFKKPSKGASVHIDPKTQDLSNEMKIKNPSDLTVGNVSHPGFDGDVNTTNMCFGCWSAGNKRKCNLHLDIKDPSLSNKSQTMLLCRNWDLAVMRRRYRSEEIQEVFMKKAASLRYDTQRKKFMEVVEQRHPVYRTLASTLERYNNRARLYQKVQRWFLSFAEEVRRGVVKPGRTAEKAKLMRAKRCIVQGGQVRAYTNSVQQLLPMAPTTGYSWPERIGIAQYLFDHPDPALGVDVQLIIAPPTKPAIALYFEREYHLSAPRSIPMPKPDYGDPDEVVKVLPTNKIIDDTNPAAWLEKIASDVTRGALSNAQLQVVTITPQPGLELLRRSKYSDPCTVKFATLGRKATPGMKAKGGLPLEFLVLQLITTFIPPQYGNLMVMDKATISPGISPEVTISFKSLPMPPVTPPFIPRPVEHPLNYRRSPTITISSKATLEDKYLYGLNRPEQTGEQESHGFRTTAWGRYLLTHEETSAIPFTLSEEVVSLNVPSSNLPITTHADFTYPFCEPSTRDNTTLDFYHLLLTGVHSASKPQIFTSITAQAPGEFQYMCDTSKPLGNLLVSVYRSWAFTQKDTIVEFKSDDGVSYWYHRRTGQTFWERPLQEEETISPLLGGTVVDDVHDEEPFTLRKGEPGAKRRYSQGEFRKIMLKHHETPEEAATRRRGASASGKIARQRGIIPDVVDGMSNFPNNNSSMMSGFGSNISNNGNVIAVQGEHNPLQTNKFSTIKKENNAIVSSTASTNRPSSPHGSVLSTESSLLSPSKSKSQPNNSQEQHNNNNNNNNSNSYKNGMYTGLGSPGSIDYQNTMSGDLLENSEFVDSPSKRRGGSATMDQQMVSNMTNVLGQMLANMNLDNKSPQDMVQLGLGMGLAIMQATNMMPPQSNNRGHDMQIEMESQSQDHGMAFSYSQQPSYANTSNEPIGLPNGETQLMATKTLNHSEKSSQLQRHNQLQNTPLNALENALELQVQQPTETPDEFMDNSKYAHLYCLNADEEVKKDFPVLVYPELASDPNNGQGPPPDFTTHSAAGVGTSFTLKKDGDHQDRIDGSAVLRKAVAKLPVGFYNSISSTRVGKQHVDYLPQVPNLPTSAAVGRVKPRSAAVDWLAIGFDPWSAGRSPLSVEFIATLSTKAEQLFDEKKLLEVKKAKEDGVISVKDTEGLTAQSLEVSKQQKLAEDFKKICSLCRHSKFSEVEDMMNHPDWNLSMQYQDDTGNTLLHIASQNGNKRMIKLCLRRGAEINAQNLNGQTPIHFAYSYGYSAVGEYLVSKGADDTILNKDGLTCYEGLSEDTIQRL